MSLDKCVLVSRYGQKYYLCYHHGTCAAYTMPGAVLGDVKITYDVFPCCWLAARNLRGRLVKGVAQRTP